MVVDSTPLVVAFDDRTPVDDYGEEARRGREANSVIGVRDERIGNGHLAARGLGNIYGVSGETIDRAVVDAQLSAGQEAHAIKATSGAVDREVAQDNPVVDAGVDDDAVDAAG